MLFYTLDRMMKGDQSVVDGFVKARAQWATLLDDLDTVSVTELARRLTTAQSWFESHCGGDRPEGQEVMAWSGFTFLFSILAGWGEREDRGLKLLRAFNASHVSGEIKGWAEAAAKHYWLDLKDL